VTDTATPVIREALDICIVTADVVGPIRNGGIGTAYSSLARTLARAGHRVTVLYVLGKYSEQGAIEDWQMAYAQEGITLVPMPAAPVQGHGALKMAVGAYEWIKTRRFDVVHYHEWRGVGAYIAQAKRQGLCLTDAVLVAGVHSPSLWHLEGMRETATPEHLEVDFLERQSVALADELWSPSRYMVTWLRREGWRLPKRRTILPNAILDEANHAARGAGPSPELVFFGRLETRKGLDVFCDAIDRVVATGLLPSTITFLGKSATVDGQSSLEFIRGRAEQWPFPTRVETTFDRSQAMAYLGEHGRVAVLPSRLDNSPYTVLECLAARIPFVASAIGGIPELINRADRARVLFDISAPALAERLRTVIARGQAPVRPEQPFALIRAAWLAWHDDVVDVPRRCPRPRAAARPLVSVCMTTRNRPAFLAAAIDSVRRQDYPRVQVVLVDDGSDRAEARAFLDAIEPDFAARGWMIVRQPNRYLGAARNRALQSATGDYVLFMDDDNLAEPHEISTFVGAAAASGADILTCFLGVFQSAHATPAPGAPSHIWPFLGAAVGPGVLRNVFGDANAFIRRRVFERIGGFTEDVGVGCEDWEFFARAVLSGLRLEVVPEPLVRYRQSPSGMLQTTSKPANHLRALRPYTSLLPQHARALVPIAAHAAHMTATASAAATLDGVRTAVVFGSGDAGRRAIALARTCGWDVGWIVDNNPGTWNQTAYDLPVKSPASLSSGGFDLVIVASLAGKNAIAKQLTDLGLSPGQHFVHFLDPVRVGGLTHQVSLA
jgi:glycosyltransferase involved in cell wall biosynthesis/GT2 family glycosyltransferase